VCGHSEKWRNPLDQKNKVQCYIADFNKELFKLFYKNLNSISESLPPPPGGGTLNQAFTEYHDQTWTNNECNCWVPHLCGNLPHEWYSADNWWALCSPDVVDGISRGGSWWPMLHILSLGPTSSPTLESWWAAGTSAYWMESRCCLPPPNLQAGWSPVSKSSAAVFWLTPSSPSFRTSLATLSTARHAPQHHPPHPDYTRLSSHLPNITHVGGSQIFFHISAASESTWGIHVASCSHARPAQIADCWVSSAHLMLLVGLTISWHKNVLLLKAFTKQRSPDSQLWHQCYYSTMSTVSVTSLQQCGSEGSAITTCLHCCHCCYWWGWQEPSPFRPIQPGAAVPMAELLRLHVNLFKTECIKHLVFRV
jgi:hypothetical protein